MRKQTWRQEGINANQKLRTQQQLQGAANVRLTVPPHTKAEGSKKKQVQQPITTLHHSL